MLTALLYLSKIVFQQETLSETQVKLDLCVNSPSIPLRSLHFCFLSFLHVRLIPTRVGDSVAKLIQCEVDYLNFKGFFLLDLPRM